ncbi:MAG TPA: hypothetical protein VK968_07760 [Roseimicrobium sp.]|nr:hypothetical protein [Roseimicrobium sp.]
MRSCSTRSAGLSILEMLVAGAVLTIFAVGASYSMLTFNRTATVTRNYVAAQAIVRDCIGQALAADYTPTTTPAILATTAAGSDIDGDGETDGVLYDPAGGTNYDVPLLYKRDTLVSNVQQAALTGQLYRKVRTVDSSLKILEVSFLMKITYRTKNYYYKMATLKAQDERQ